MIGQGKALREQTADLASGMNEWDRERAHHQAKENASHMYDEHYVRGQNADQYNPNEYDPPQQFGRGRGDYGNNYGNNNDY